MVVFRPNDTEASDLVCGGRYCPRIVRYASSKTIIRRYVGTSALSGRLEDMDSVLCVAYVLSSADEDVVAVEVAIGKVLNAAVIGASLPRLFKSKL